MPLEVQAPPEVDAHHPDYTVLTGATKHRIIGNGFQPGCMVTLAGVPARSVKFLSPNMLEVVSDAGPACQGSVEVTNPDHTASELPHTSNTTFPPWRRIRITPAQDVLAPGMKAQFNASASTSMAGRSRRR